MLPCFCDKLEKCLQLENFILAKNDFILMQFNWLNQVYDERIRGCNWPDLLIGEQGCDPSKRLGGFICPTSTDQVITY